MSYSFNAKGILASRLLWLDHLDNALLFVYQSKQQLLRRISFKSRVVSCGVIYSFLEVEKHKNSYMILRYTTTKSLRLTVKKKYVSYLWRNFVQILSRDRVLQVGRWHFGRKYLLAVVDTTAPINSVVIFVCYRCYFIPRHFSFRDH